MFTLTPEESLDDLEQVLGEVRAIKYCIGGDKMHLGTLCLQPNSYS